jgi:hypothetical protein
MTNRSVRAFAQKRQIWDPIATAFFMRLFLASGQDKNAFIEFTIKRCIGLKENAENASVVRKKRRKSEVDEINN